jgi:hypothetical protein
MTIWPQLTYLALVLLGVGFAIAKHGEPQLPYSMFRSLAGASIAFFLLYQGGFFAPLMRY